ncbi:DNAJ domain-containing protein DNAJB family protein [Schizosaccharomyces octosporus yFS286]|uniref:DNAJ domain-containing protein DNAJB family protein n=1 Tax=Schizosaccharomyces octosporus (strain yFS286) TaxID=483514 RepID=S9QWI4_SCHOY|nr:DNAJ domain-containing protein DNAJB family protein [Schizosaccharomyces octosporus yFS286]EPX70655.1 DNAJ domain-containing protein DNAJB family protein [Schizosaccharomyces octosporus yFS286]
MKYFISQFSRYGRLNWFRKSATTFTPKNLKSLTPYEIMELPRTCTPADIKRKYIELVKLRHPDKNKSGSPEDVALKALDEKNRQEYFRLLVAAKSLLTDHQRRLEYDRFGFHWNQLSGSQPSPKPSANPRYPMYSRYRRSSGMGSWEEYYYNSFDFEQNHKAKGDFKKEDDEGMIVFAAILSLLIIFSVYSNYRNSKFYREARAAAIEQSEGDFGAYSTGMSDLSKDDRISRFLIIRDQSLKSDSSPSSSSSELPLHTSSPSLAPSSSSELSLPAPASPPS